LYARLSKDPENRKVRSKIVAPTEQTSRAGPENDAARRKQRAEKQEAKSCTNDEPTMDGGQTVQQAASQSGSGGAVLLDKKKKSGFVFNKVLDRRGKKVG